MRRSGDGKVRGFYKQKNSEPGFPKHPPSHQECGSAGGQVHAERMACELLEPEATSASAGPVAREQKRSDAQKLPDEGERKPHGKERRVKGKMGTYLASGQVDLRCWAYVTGAKSYWESNRLDAPCRGSSVWSEA